MRTNKYLNLKNFSFILLSVLIVITGCKKDNSTVNPESPVFIPNPLCFTAEEDGATIMMGSVSKTTTLDDRGINRNIEYSFDKNNWERFSVGTTLITLDSVGDKVYFRGNNPDGFNIYHLGNIYFITNDKKIAASGNVMSLIDTTCKSTTIPEDFSFMYMFSGTSITTAPELPATTLAYGCYDKMFAFCNNLTVAPELPATTLAHSCYSGMFEGCASLTATPELPATTLATQCYAYMFSNCDNLIDAPELPATVLSETCYLGMFSRCDNLKNAPKLPVMTLAKCCYKEMFDGCVSLTTAPELPATTLEEGCYMFMFKDCENLTTSPELPATTLVKRCYWEMFNGCNRLNNIKVHFTEWDDDIYDNATYRWVKNVSSSGTFHCPSSLPQEFGNHCIPEGWTVETF